MYDQQFEVWTYGPIVRLQYLRFKRFASEYILGHFEQNSILTSLNPIIFELLTVDVFTLVDISTRLPFWVQHKDKIKKGIKERDSHMGKLVDDKRKALLKARLEKEKEGIVIEETKPKEMIIDTVIDMSCL